LAMFCYKSFSDKCVTSPADLNAAYMAKRPLAMCNQLTGCGKPTKCFIMKRRRAASSSR
jgi:hypothetical protein